jgi:hypothetical protein
MDLFKLHHCTFPLKVAVYLLDISIL